VVIPTLDRPDELCLTTLALLRSHGVSLADVGMFITPSTTDTNDAPEWSRYLRALKRHDMLEVQLLPGARGLEKQMEKAMEWVSEGYMITMSDTVKEIFVRKLRKTSRKPFLAPMTKGLLPSLFHHGRDLLGACQCTAWSVNPMHNAGRMNDNALISRKLGLLDGNFSGMLLPADWRQCRVSKSHGLIYDVEWSASLWSRGHKFVRYMDLCSDHTYRRPGGQATLFADAHEEVAARFPSLLLWCPKPQPTLKTMQYRFRALGQEPLMMAAKTCSQRGRPNEHLVGRALTGAEKVRQRRAGRKLNLSAL